MLAQGLAAWEGPMGEDSDRASGGAGTCSCVLAGKEVPVVGALEETPVLNCRG